MEHTSPETTAANAPARHWPLFLGGALLFLLGPALYAVQVSRQHLDTPWHVPTLATLGLLFMAISVGRRGGILRTAGLVLFFLVCGLEWFLVLVGTRSPLYTGPAQPGLTVPQFAAARADGTAFSNKDLENGSSTLLLFFRGRW